MPTAKFFFYKVSTADGHSLQNAFDELYEYPCNERACDIDGKHCLLLDDKYIPKNTKIFAGLFSRIRMIELPHKMRADGSRAPIDLEEDEGLGEHVAISFHNDLEVISIQSNRFSLSANGIASFLNKIFPGLNVVFTPILAKDALERFSRMKAIRKLRVKVAGTTDLSFLNGDTSLSTEEKILIQEMLNGPYVEITKSMGYAQGALGEGAKRLIDFFKNFSNTPSGAEAVQVLQITGKEDDESAAVLIDLLSERLTHEQDVDLDGRTVDIGHLLRAAYSSLMINYNELKSSHVEENN